MQVTSHFLSEFYVFDCFQPGCEYTVKLKGGDVNVHIERSMPRSRHIQVFSFLVTDYDHYYLLG